MESRLLQSVRAESAYRRTLHIPVFFLASLRPLASSMRQLAGAMLLRNGAEYVVETKLGAETKLLARAISSFKRRVKRSSSVERHLIQTDQD
jgi:hypothetical protein